MEPPATHYCRICQLPCDSGPRVKDSQGRLYHRECYEAARARQIEQQARLKPRQQEKQPSRQQRQDEDANPRQRQDERARQQRHDEGEPRPHTSIQLTPIDEPEASGAIPNQPTASTPPSAGMPSGTAATADMCPGCAAPLSAGAVLCTHCGYDLLSRKKRVTDLSYATRPRRGGGPSVVREFGYFGCGYGLVLIIFGVVGITMRSGAANAQNATVMTWLSAFLLIIPGLMNIVGGILAFTTRSKASIILCMVGSLALPIFYFGVPLLMGTAPGFNCMTVLLIVIPLTVVNRAAKALEELKS